MPSGVVIGRYLSRERNVLAARGVFTALFADYVAHARRWVGEPPEFARAKLEPGLAAAALYLTCRPRDEHTAWTFNFPEPPLNLFIGADAGPGHVVGRHFSEHVRSTASNRLFVQTARRIGTPHLSAVEVRGFDILAILEGYYVQSEQASVRFFAGDGDEFVMLMALPGIDEGWLWCLGREEGLACARWPDMRPIETREVSFACSCSATRIGEIVVGMFRDREEDLFAGAGQVEVNCPRCGRSYDLTRQAFAQELRRGAGEGGGPDSGTSA